MNKIDQKVFEELCKVEHIKIPDELIDAYASIFTKNMRAIMDTATYLFCGPPTPEQYTATMWMLQKQGQDRLEEEWGGPLP